MGKRGLGLVIYGPPGVGKTTFAANFPGPTQFLSVKETGFEDLYDVGAIPEWCSNEVISSWEDLCMQIKRCNAKTLVIDSLSGVQQVLFRYCTDKFYDGDIKKFSAFYNGIRNDAPAVMEREFETLLTAKRNAGTHVVLIGHTKITQKPNALGNDYLAHVLDIDIGIGGVINKWAQAILFMALDIEAVKNGSNKAKGTESRVLYTGMSPGHDAKSRSLGLPDPIMLGTSPEEGFKKFWDKIPAVYK